MTKRMLSGMSRLPARDFERMLDLAVALLDTQSSMHAWPLVTDELNGSLHGTITMLNADIQPQAYAAQTLAVAPTPAAELFHDLVRVGVDDLPANPFIRHFVTTADAIPRTVDEVIDGGTWRRSRTYDFTRRLLGVTDHLAMPLRAPSGTLRAFWIARDGPGFSDRDREFARRIQPILMRVDSHLIELDRLRARYNLAFDNQESLQARAAHIRVTPRELTVLSLLAEGLTAAAIARRLRISPHTVTKHQENLYRKLNASDRLTAVLIAQRHGLLLPDQQ